MTLIMGLVFVWFILVILLSKWIRKFNLYLYGLCMVIAAVLFTQETNIVNMGYVGLSFFILVMFASTLSQGTIRKKLMGNRAELAVMGSIFSLSHGLKYLIFAFDYTFFWRAPIYFYIGIASVIMMLPLAITSIMIIRKKMKGKDWKKLHKFSYLFYGLVATHLLLINNERFFFYVILFGLYMIYKLLSLIQKQPVKPKEKVKIA